MTVLLIVFSFVSPSLAEIISEFDFTKKQHSNFCCIVKFSHVHKGNERDAYARVYKSGDLYRLDYLASLTVDEDENFELDNAKVMEGYILGEDEIVEYTRSPSGAMVVERHPRNYEPIVESLYHYLISPVTSIYAINEFSVSDLCQLPSAKVVEKSGETIVVAEKVSQRVGTHTFTAVIETNGPFIVTKWVDRAEDVKTVATVNIKTKIHPEIGPVVQKYDVDVVTDHVDWPPTHSTTEISNYRVWNDQKAFEFASLFLYGDQIAIQENGKQTIVNPPQKLDDLEADVRSQSSWIIILNAAIVVAVIASLVFVRFLKPKRFAK